MGGLDSKPALLEPLGPFISSVSHLIGYKSGATVVHVDIESIIKT